jgi:hypothetical protein
MNNRRGEKMGWIGGWSGGFIWLVILSVLFLFQGRYLEVLVSIANFVAAFILIFVTAPWRHPTVRYWKLMLPIYAMLILSLILPLWAFGSPTKAGLSGWSFLWLLPALIPLWIIGNKTWNDNAI